MFSVLDSIYTLLTFVYKVLIFKELSRRYRVLIASLEAFSLLTSSSINSFSALIITNNIAVNLL